MGLWVAAFVNFYESEDMKIYTNVRYQELDKTPRYQKFIYQADSLPGFNELILSFHSDTSVRVRKTMHYYRRTLADWAHVAHISYAADGRLVIQSGLTTYNSLKAIDENSNGIWVLHNPQQTDLQTMPVYADWLLTNYQHCQRYVDEPEAVIDFYLKRDFPCELVTSAAPMQIRYDHGAELGNIIREQSPDSIEFFLRWRASVYDKYAYSLQVYDSAGEKVLQTDHVITGEPTDKSLFDISELSAGDYLVRLIVYDRATITPQSGVVVNSTETFERAIEVARFAIS